MTGFKSFADKTVIEFNEGMTAVVGPNGSGKSNLSEAIRWVLGEQSAKSLRGNRMEDVIFNGTQARKPVNIAKVTLVLNNEDRYLDYDFSEISITRSYNRNGDSQYLINNEQVRLRDIVDLLLDSGLGKNSFSIISQGQVEQIFLSKPEERRTIFEEAAGVQKYQYRKTEAERRLDKSSDNLSRVKDIIHELELQLNPLRKQRETALLYTSKKEELKELEVSLYTQQIEDYQTGWEELEEQLKNIDVTLNNLITQNETLSNEIDASKNKQNQLINAIDQNSDTYQKLTSQIEKLRAQQQMIEKDIHYSETEQADKANIYEEQVAEKTRLDQDITEYTKQLQTFDTDLKALMTELKEVNKDIQISQGLNANQQDELRNEMLEYYQLEAKSNNEIQQQKAILERQRARKDQAVEKMNSTSKELTKLEVEAKEAEEELEAFTGSQSEQRTLLQELSENNEKLSNQRDELRQLLFNQERQTQTIETRLNSLKQMHDNYTGYYAGVRAVMQQAQRLNGIEGTVADLLNVKETYQLAIDTALGGSMQHIVVANDQAAREAVNYLKQQRAGRATFLPRPNIKPRQIQSFKLFQAQEMQGFIAVASELVSYDAQNENIVQNILGNTIVAQTLVDAQSIARALGHSVKIVTLEGDVLMPGGSLTGGQQKQRQQSMLSRQNEIKQASEAYETYREQLKNIEQDWEKVSSELAHNDQQLKEQRQQVNQTEGIYQRLFQTSQNAKQAYKQANNQMIILKDSIREFDEELDEARNTIEQAEQNLVKAKSSIEELNRILEQHNLDEDARQKKLAELEELRQDKSTQKAVMDVEIKQLKQTLSDLKNQYEVVNNWITNYESSKTFGLSSIEELQEKLEETLDDIAKLEKESESLQKQIQVDRQNRQELSETINEKESLLNKSQAESQRSFQTQAKLQAQIEKNQA
jgi:chromosome segregation protein